MVINSSFRSASPMSVRSNPNPNPNLNPSSNPSQRGGNIERKSFNGYPFAKKGFVPNTPLNSPAEYARCSFDRDSGGVQLRDHEQKENERDLNIKPLARARSPSIVTTKGTKNFMSPTISAASKINPSPRKKVLGERNDAIRTSASLSDGKFHFFTANSLDFEHETEPIQPKPVVEPMSFDKAENEVKFEAFEADLVVLSPEVPLNVVKSSESLPLSEMPKMVADEDPTLDASHDAVADLSLDSLPPYDPKNNFLSPRPQFLHYNPNWRTENYVNQGVNLEDDFTSGSVSETENSSEAAQSEETSSVGVSPEEMPQLSEQATESEEVVEMVEPALEPKMVEPALEPKRCRWFNWKFAAVLLLLSLGFTSISLAYPGITGSVMYRDEIVSRLYNSPYTTALAENFDIYIQKAKVWSALSADWLSQMLNNVKGVEKFSPLAFGNLTSWQEAENRGFVVEKFELLPYFESIEDDQTVVQADIHAELEDDDPYFASMEDDGTVIQEEIHGELEDGDPSAGVAEIIELDDFQAEEAEQIPETPENNDTSAPMQNPTTEANDDASEKGGEFLKQSYDTEDASSAQMQSSTPDENEASSSGVDELVKEVECANEADLSHSPPQVPEFEADIKGEASLEENEPSIGVDELVNEISDSPLLVPEIQQEVNTENEPSEKADTSPADDVQPVDSDITDPDTESIVHKAADENSQQLSKENEKSLVPTVASIILAIVTLIAAFMYMKSKNDGPSTDRQVKQETEKATVEERSLSVTPSSRGGQVEVDMVGESCPSEMSSFQNSAYTKSKQRERAGGDDEADTPQKRTKRSSKRESLASSSSEYTMNSYGSFSTYSVIHPKHGDDQVVTPVRRSSRIRSKVTSP